LSLALSLSLALLSLALSLSLSLALALALLLLLPLLLPLPLALSLGLFIGAEQNLSTMRDVYWQCLQFPFSAGFPSRGGLPPLLCSTFSLGRVPR
jgi:hypothetical protein